MNHKDRHNPFPWGPHCLHNSYLSALFNNNHNKIAYDVKRSHKYYKSKNYEHHYFFKFQGREKILVHLHPVLCIKRRFQQKFNLIRYLFGMIKIIYFHFYTGNSFVEIEKFLGFMNAYKSKAWIIFIHACFKKTNNLKFFHFGNHSKRAKLANRRHHLNHITNKQTQVS